MRRINNRYYGSVVIVILLFMLAAAGALRYQMRDNTEDTSITEGNSLNTSQEPEAKPKPSDAFAASKFFDQIQTGMSYNQVKNLAGGTIGDCGTTDVHPDSGRMSCTWSDASLRVTVNFSQDKVISKQKASL